MCLTITRSFIQRKKKKTTRKTTALPILQIPIAEIHIALQVYRFVSSANWFQCWYTTIAKLRDCGPGTPARFHRIGRLLSKWLVARKQYVHISKETESTTWSSRSHAETSKCSQCIQLRSPCDARPSAHS